MTLTDTKDYDLCKCLVMCLTDDWILVGSWDPGGQAECAMGSSSEVHCAAFFRRGMAGWGGHKYGDMSLLVNSANGMDEQLPITNYQMAPSKQDASRESQEGVEKSGVHGTIQWVFSRCWDYAVKTSWRP